MLSNYKPMKVEGWDRKMFLRYGDNCPCGGRPVVMSDGGHSTGYKIVKCDNCGKETCVDTNIVVVLQDWSRGANHLTAANV